MASEAQPSPPRGNTPSIIPTKRTLEDTHTPSVSSPLNPNPPRPYAAPAREPRSKKESLKKREASGTSSKPAAPEKGSKSKKLKDSDDHSLAASPIRYNHPLPPQPWQYTDKETHYISHEPDPIYAPDGIELKKPLDHTENRKNFRYTHCVADPAFKHSHYYRQTDSLPYGPRMSRADSDKLFHYDARTACTITNEKGWRMGRANVVAREGTFYYEIKILKGVPLEGSPASLAAASTGPLPHIRMGWARREAPLDAPVGFDAYSYGLTDIRMEPMHKSRAFKFLDNGDDAAVAAAAKKKVSKKKPGANPNLSSTAFASNDHARTGDVIGLSITLPPLALHRKVASGIYNPLVDTGSGATSSATETAPNILRDRIPVAYRNAMYFESLELRSSKGMEGYGDRGPFARETPNPNHDDPTLRSLPGSSIKVWKNGKRVGTAFRALMAFLPPCSAPEVSASKAGKGKEVADDGAVGYFPAVGAFSGAVAEVNFGPRFWYPPEELVGGEGGVGGASGGEGGFGGGDGATPADTTMKEPAADANTDANSPVKTEPPQQTTSTTTDADTPMTGTEPAQPAQTPISNPALKTTPATTVSGTAPMRGMHERYKEQIAEDVVYDVVDEVDFFVQDGGGLEELEGGGVGVKVED